MPLRHFQDLFDKFLRHTRKTITYRKICQGHISETFTVRVQISKIELFGYIETLKTVF